MELTEADFVEIRRILGERGTYPALIDEFCELAAGMTVEQIEAIIVEVGFQRIVDGYG